MAEHSYHRYAPLDPATGKPLCYCEQDRRGLPNADHPTMPDRMLLACKVAAVVDDAVILNRGSDDGVELGMTFALGGIIPIHDPVTKEHLGDVDQRPRLRVTGLRPRITVCHPAGVRPVQANIGATATIVVDAAPLPPPPFVPDFDMNTDASGSPPWWATVLLALLITTILAFVVWQSVHR